MIIDYLKKFFKEKNFTFKSNTGILKTNFNSYIVVNFQKSQFNLGYFYVNLGIVYENLNESKIINIHSLHLSSRIEDFIDDNSFEYCQLKNFENVDYFEDLKKILESKVIPILNFYSNIHNLKQLIKNNSIEINYFMLCKITDEEFCDFILFNKIPNKI